ncbi:MAG: hypothetical protein J4F34_04545, partial [Gemmatimonadetes bacterium]|nr:hypothetical protein [Gemmatimonadota bacterium]
GGVATTTAMIKVALSMEMIGESVVLEDVVIVTPRAGWSLQEQRARLQWVRGEPIGDSAWGVYVGGWPTPQTLAGTVPGSGPWAGSHILSVAPPTITATAMYAHRDLLSDGEPYPIPLTDTICGLSGSSVGVHNLNITCGYKRSLETFRDAVAIHEGRHQESLNECVRAVNTDGRLAAVEAIVGTFPGHAEDQALTLWTNGLVPALLKAKRTAQGPVSGDIWHWRQFSKWRYGGKTVGHTGTEGCPPIT